TLLCWMTGNAVVEWTGHPAWDPVPFALLDTFATLAALCVTLLILTAQRHADELTARREQLILHLTMLSDQKSAKIIELLEEMRRDDPLIANRIDPQAVAMSKITRPAEVIEVAKDALGPNSDERPA